MYFKPDVYPTCTERRSSADSSEPAFQLRKPSQSPRRHPQRSYLILQAEHRSFRLSHVMRVPRCHVAPLYHVTLLPELQLPCLKTASAFCTQIFRHFSIRSSLVDLVVRICVQQFHYRHRCGEEGHGESPLSCTLGPTALSMVGFKIRQRGSVSV